MATLSLACPSNVTSVANRILTAWMNGRDAVLRSELNSAARLGMDADRLNFVEQERMEVLQSVVESIRQKDQLSGAGLKLLKHLAASQHS